MAAPMKLSYFLIICCIFSCKRLHARNVNTTKGVLKKFEEFIIKFNKTYTPGTNEYRKKLGIFEENLHIHELLNDGYKEGDEVYGINKFSDLTSEEFKVKYLNGLTPQLAVSAYSNQGTALKFFPKKINVNTPTTKDWRDDKIVTGVKNQESCGACWAFSSVETVESMYALKSGNLKSLSVQEMTDCAEDNFGCMGGDICSALDWLKRTQTPLLKEEQYPLTNKNQPCQIIPPGAEGVRISNYKCSGYVGVESKMVDSIANHGPLTVSVDAATWHHYMGGIIQHHCDTYLNHAVQVVGYDQSGPVPYYIVRNSWGPDWGLDGYLKIRVGANTCGIASRVAYVDI